MWLHVRLQAHTGVRSTTVVGGVTAARSLFVCEGISYINNQWEVRDSKNAEGRSSELKCF